jgi:esterase/lipase superfamily enzyme
MESNEYIIHSSYLNRDMHILRYGSGGVPFYGISHTVCTVHQL